MPVVRILGEKVGDAPSEPPFTLSEVLAEKAGMDSQGVADAIKRLSKGRFVDTYFDLGEDAPGRAFMNELANMGLRSELYDDRRLPWYGPRPQSWFVRYVVGGFLALSSAWFGAFRAWPRSVFSGIMTVVLVVFALSVPIVFIVQRRALMTEQELDSETRLKDRWVVGFLIVLFLIYCIRTEPWLGVVLLVSGLGGATCAAIIRAMHQRP